MRYLAIDIETTGLDVFIHDACEIGFAWFNHSGNIRKLYAKDLFVGPEAVVDDLALEVNGFTRERMKQGQDPAVVLTLIEKEIARLNAFEEPVALVFHNAPFDVPFIKKIIRKYPEGFPFLDKALRRVLDTVSMDYVIRLRQNRSSVLRPLSVIAENRLSPCEVANWGKHTALGDAEITARVAIACMDAS